MYGAIEKLLDMIVIYYSIQRRKPILRHPQCKVEKRIASEGEKSICTSIVVAAELRFGANKRGFMRLTIQLEVILSAMEILPLEEPADHLYAELRTFLENRGTPIGPRGDVYK